jgi:hypothetical protein
MDQKQGGTIDAIQIESARSHRDPEVVDSYARSVACALRQFVCRSALSVASPEVTSLTYDVIQSDCSKGCHAINGQNSSPSYISWYFYSAAVAVRFTVTNQLNVVSRSAALQFNACNIF